MEAIKYIKQIYSGSNALEKHITLFSLAGLFGLLTNNILSTYGSNMFFSFLTAGISSNIELWLNIFMLIIIFLLSIGYEFVYTNQILNNGNYNLSEIDNKSFIAFAKIFPVFILLGIYFLMYCTFGTVLAQALNNIIYIYIVASIMFCSFPFFEMLLIKFSKDFKYSWDIIYPLAVFRILDAKLGDVIFWGLEFCLFAFLPLIGLYFMFKFGINVKSENLKLVLYLFNISLLSYVLYVLKLIFSAGLATIVKDS